MLLLQGGEVVCEVASTNQWNFDVAWCPRNPALISSCSFDGHVSIYSLTGGAQPQVQTSNKVCYRFCKNVGLYAGSYCSSLSCKK